MVEFINVAKDDAFAWPKVARRSYPSATEARMASTIIPFIRKSLDVNNTLIEVFNEKLGLPEGTLAEKHDLEEFSGSEARCIRSPPKPDGVTQDRATIGAHTVSSRYIKVVVTSLMNFIRTLVHCRSCITVWADYRSWYQELKNGSTSRYSA